MPNRHLLVAIATISSVHCFFVRHIPAASGLARYSVSLSSSASRPRTHPDFSGEWEMDMKSSEPLGPVLRELGVPRLPAAVVARLAVRQSIHQNASHVSIHVNTVLSRSILNLLLDGSESLLPGLDGGPTAAVSRWLDDERLETRQLIGDGNLLDPHSTTFVTTRSLPHRNGSTLLEACTVIRAGVLRASAKRFLLRCITEE